MPSILNNNLNRAVNTVIYNHAEFLSALEIFTVALAIKKTVF